MLLLAAIALSAAPVAPLQDAEGSKPKKERKICKSMETSGTRMGGRRVCKTVSEWQTDEDDAVADLERRRRENFPTASGLGDTGRVVPAGGSRP